MKRLCWGASILLWSCFTMAADALPKKNLDDLVAQRLPEQMESVRLMEPAEFSSAARIETLPRETKTTYMVDTLEFLRLQRASGVKRTMLLRSDANEQVVAYVDEDAYQQAARELKENAMIRFDAIHVWNSRHGPGLLITRFITQ